MNGPAILTQDEVVGFLRDMAKGFESGDTDEGSCEILLPPYTADKDFYESVMPEEMKGWYEWHEDGPEQYYRLSKDAPRDRFLVRMSYRIGRNDGQGGVRLINDSTWKSKPPSDGDARL